MSKKLLLSTISTLTILNILNIDNIGYAKNYGTIEEAKKEHPNADFKVNPSDGSFTYTYGKSNGNVNNGRNNNDDGQHNTSTNHSSGQNNVAHRYSTSQKKVNQPQESNQSNSNNLLNRSNGSTPLPDVQNGNNDQGGKINNSDTPPQNNRSPIAPPNLNNDDDHNADVSQAFKKDKHGMITNLDMDDLYDELKVSEFNEKAKTKDGKPLALGNGKIISQPLFTNKNNLYTAGQCTWYAFDKRAQDGHTISTFWGDAKNWAGQASSAGFKVDHTPEKGAILQTINGPYGHVAYVERVNSDGSVYISEMNWVAPYIVSTRTISSNEAGSYSYIH